MKAFEKILRLAAFNVFAHNCNDHSKNVSFLMDEKGYWKLAPAYDLTFSSSSHGMYSTMVAGENAHPTKKHLIGLANYFKIKNAALIIDQVSNTVKQWKKYADQCDVSKVSKNKIEKVINWKK
ncbi:MAG: HipA domain-containing protein [bacterium]|nr:HipA domain-containing protein [bacterium]